MISTLRSRILLGALLLAGALVSPAWAASRQDTLFNFDLTPPGGYNPYAGVIQASDGQLYGTTQEGGDSPCTCGVVFRFGPEGYQPLVSFVDKVGIFPTTSLIQAQNGLLYGTTGQGGGLSHGSAYRLALDGSGLRSMHAFTAQEGAPNARLMEAPDGHFYGTTFLSGGIGNAFRMAADGAVEIIHTFTDDEGHFSRGGFTLASDNKMYAVTVGGTGGAGLGAVIRMSLDGSVEVLHRFTGADGASPASGLVVGPDGALYGTTLAGGDRNEGTVFRMALDGSFARLHSFVGKHEGKSPRGALARVGEYLYGTTSEGGSKTAGTAGTTFRVSPTGEFLVIHKFGAATGDGRSPWGDLTATQQGRLVGTTTSGGVTFGGTLFGIRP